MSWVMVASPAGACAPGSPLASPPPRKRYSTGLEPVNKGLIGKGFGPRGPDDCRARRANSPSAPVLDAAGRHGRIVRVVLAKRQTTREKQMDFGLKGKTALVCASSAGLGRGCAEALAGEGVNLVINGRTEETLEATAADLRTRFGVEVTAVAADVTTEEGRAKLLEAAGEADILVNNAGGPPPGTWTDWEREDFIKALDANMLTPIALIKAMVPGMMERGWGRVVNITSRAVKAPIPALGLSNSARAGLTGYVAGTSRQIARSGVTMNNLLPGMHDTDRVKKLDQNAADTQGISFDEARKKRLAGSVMGRDGTAEEFGAACAFLCSKQAAFITGQNILADGGEVNATL
jgi:3-oxoacyl-[acyl-carrier protein] reductase